MIATTTHPAHYRRARVLAESARNMDAGKPVANNTRLYLHSNGDVALRLHRTDVVTWHPDGTVTLDTGGWRTVTTKDRMSGWAPGARVEQTNGSWAVVLYQDSPNEPGAVVYDWEPYERFTYDPATGLRIKP